MPDISEELETIAHEAKGRLVKEAIYNALVKINQEADRRPKAINGVPIDEVIIDTGWITDARIGELVPGELLKFSGSIGNGYLSSEDTYTARTSLIANDSGRVFIVTYSYDPTLPTAPEELINIGDEIEWELVRTISNASTQAKDSDAYMLQQEFPGAVIKGYVYDVTELPDPSTATVGDVWVINNIYSYATSFICQENNSTKTWVDTELLWQDVVGSKHFVITIWTAAVDSQAAIDVKFESSNPEIAIGIFAVYDRDDFSASTLPYKVSVPSTSGRTFMSTPNVRGTVARRSDLPETVTEGDYWIVEDTDSCYAGESGAWVYKGAAYDAQFDTRAYAGAEEGIRSGTAKIYVFNCYYPNPVERKPHFKMVDAGGSEMTGVAYPMGSGCPISAWYQSDGSSSFPNFKYETGTEDYVNLYDGSAMIYAIEIGSQLGGGST